MGVTRQITAFLESADFEDAIRNAISIGGDSDTIAAITGSIAEAAYGIPDWIKDKAYILGRSITLYETYVPTFAEGVNRAIPSLISL